MKKITNTKNRNVQKSQKWKSFKDYDTIEKRKITVELDISNRNLEGKLDLSDFENLKILDCSKNEITSIILPKNSKLEKFDLSENELSNIKDIELNKCLNLRTLDIRNNNFRTRTKNSSFDLSSFSQLKELEELYLGNTNEERIKDYKYNRFSGSLIYLKDLEKLSVLDISNTDIYDSPKIITKNLPESLIKVIFSKEIKKIRGDGYSNSVRKVKDFKVSLIRNQIENHFSIKKAANLPTFFERHQEELEYYDPNPFKWGLEEKIRDKNDGIYGELYPNDVSKTNYNKDYKVKFENLPTRLLKINTNKEGDLKLELVEIKSLDESSSIAYAILSYNWGREKELDKKIEALEISLKRSKEEEFIKDLIGYNKINEKENFLLKEKIFLEIKEKLEKTESWKCLGDNDKNKILEKENIKKLFRENHNSFFFTEEQYKQFENVKGLKNSEGKSIIGDEVRDELEKKSPAFSKTLLKSVEACRLLNIEYLWIDQICVDQHNPSDKSYEVNQMSNYYGNSAVTLVAIHKNVSEKKIDKLDPFLAIKRIINSEWFQRSWTFQEGWLSKRTVFMFDDMLVDGGYLAQVWACNQASDLKKGKYSNRQILDDQEAKIATPIGWVSYRNKYKSGDKLTFRLHEALRGIKDRKRSFAIDGIYSILGVLPYRVEPRYLESYPKDYLKIELSRVMREAAEAGYLEYLSWHGFGDDWIPETNEKDGSTEVWGGIEIDNEKNIMNTDNEGNLYLKLEEHNILEEVKKITKIGSDLMPFCYGIIKIIINNQVREIKIWGVEQVLEVVKRDDCLLIPNCNKLQSETSFGVLAKKACKECNFENNSYLRIGLVELTKEDVKNLKGRKVEVKIKQYQEQDPYQYRKIETNKQNILHSKSKNKRIFLGGTCNDSTWRAQFISLLDQSKSKVSYFNPVVEDWNPKAQEIELRQREACDYLLYTITKETEGFYAIAEAPEDSIKQPKRTIFCYLEEGFTEHQIKSLQATARMIARNGAKVFNSLEGVVEYLNSEKLEEGIQKIYWNKEVNNEILNQIESINDLMEKERISSEILTKVDKKWKNWENKLKNKENIEEVKKYAELVKEGVRELADERDLETKLEVAW